MIKYKGFSTVNNTRKTKLTDFELAKQDLINHFHIRKGEKLHNPNFGSNLWSVVFDPLTTSSKQAIIDDIKAVVSYDPRINVVNVNVVEYDQGIQVELDLEYIDSDQTDTLRMMFDQSDQSLTAL
jgi:phage baseplate assembly protein W